MTIHVFEQIKRRKNTLLNAYVKLYTNIGYKLNEFNGYVL